MSSQWKLFDDPDTEPIKRKEKNETTKQLEDQSVRKTSIYENKCPECKHPPRFEVTTGLDKRFCTAKALCPVCGKLLGTDQYVLSDRMIKMFEKRKA